MATIKMSVRLVDGEENMVFQEGEDRHGPAMNILLTGKNNFRATVARLNNVGDNEFVDGFFGRTLDGTGPDVLALFSVEADADTYAAAVTGRSKVFEPAPDGFNWKVVI